jgi:hypothetical protein
MIQEAVIIAFLVYGIHVAFQQGMIFQKIDIHLMQVLPSWAYKPLIGCPICMAPWYGIMYIELYWGLIFSFFDTAIILIMAMGMVRLLINISKEI